MNSKAFTPLIWLSVALLLIAGCGTVIAQDEMKRDLAKIAAMADSVERLAAYDAYAARLGAAPNSVVTRTSVDKWRLSTTTSPIDDSQTVTGMLDATGPIQTRFEAKTPVLIVRYQEGKIQAYVSFDVFLGSERTEMTVRTGKGTARHQTWNLSTDHTAAFVPDTAAFLKEIVSTDSLVLRLTPYGENPVIAAFDPTGISKVIDAIQKANQTIPVKKGY